MQDSSSSFSMSLSGSDTFEDQPSTSGCSSDMTHKEKRKSRVKQYLRQLKAMVPPSSGKKGKMGTLSALQHVIGSLQKIQEEKDKSHLAGCDALAEELDNSLFDKENQLNAQVLKLEETVHMVLTKNELSVLKVSDNITNILGYPVGSWINRNISHFVHKKDIVTLNVSLNIDAEEPVQLTDYDDSSMESKNAEGGNAGQIRKKFFFRIRNYKGLQQSGFSLMKPDRFTTVQASMAVGYYCERNKEGSPSSSSSGDSTHRRRKCIFLDCVPLRSLYNIENVQLENQTFYMRHTIYCSYSYMHPNAIPLLGYLPQDMNGMSIFDFYHRDDMETLYNIYKRIIVSKGTTFRSKPIRLRTRNGDWLTVETEWSSFANPWSHRLEFIIGQHRVIKPPSDGDVFNEADRPSMMPQLSDHQQKLQQKIRQILLEPVSEEKSNVLHEPRTDSSDDQKTLDETEKVPKKNKQQTEKYADRKAGKSSESLQSTESLGGSSLPTFNEHESSMAYEQLNYANSIKRYLMSQQKTYSSSSEKKTTSEEETDTPCTISTTTAEASDSEFEVDISVPKPPSFGSSTKVLLSEQEQREDVASSPAHQIEDNTEDTSPGSLAPAPMAPPPPVENPDTLKLVTLTHDALLRHTKQQEDLFVAHAKQERNPIILKSKEGRMLQERKRSHSPDRDKGLYRPSKAFRNDTSILIPPFPLPNMGYAVQYRQGATPKGPANCNPSYARSYRDGNVSGNPPVSQSGVSLSPTKQSQSNVESRVSPNQNNVIWPYYPQKATGAQFYPQVMGGFYQDPSGIPSTLSLNVTSTIPQTANTCHTTMSGASRHNLQVLQGHCQGPFQLPAISTSFSSSSDMSISHTDSGSSYLYLLDSDDQNSSGQEQETKSTKVTRSNKRQMEPPWLENLCWTKKLAMNYQIPKRKNNRVLKSDKAFINKSEPSSLLLQQMMELQGGIEMNQGAPVVDEESDYLFYLDEDEEDPTGSDSRFIPLHDIHEALSQCEDHSHGIGCFKDSDRNSPSAKHSEKLEESNGPGIDITLGPDEQSSSLQGDRNSSEQDDQMDCQNSIENQTSLQTNLDAQEAIDNQGPLDSLTMDIESNCSKSSSDLTPSEERSSGEAGSSLKESDAMSSKGSVDESKDSSESDVDVSNSTKKDNYHLFFVIPPIFFVDHAKTPFWCRNCEMSRNVEMDYAVKPKDTAKSLEKDMRSMKNVVQPDLVKTQMGYMLDELNLCPKEKSESGPKDKMSGAEGSKCLMKKPTSQSKPKLENFMTDDVFNGLFVTMLSEDLVSNVRENSPDIEDVSHTLEEVD